VYSIVAHPGYAGTLSATGFEVPWYVIVRIQRVEHLAAVRQIDFQAMVGIAARAEVLAVHRLVMTGAVGVGFGLGVGAVVFGPTAIPERLTGAW
jgi:hypothetical protein